VLKSVRAAQMSERRHMAAMLGDSTAHIDQLNSELRVLDAPASAPAPTRASKRKKPNPALDEANRQGRRDAVVSELHQLMEAASELHCFCSTNYDGNRPSHKKMLMCNQCLTWYHHLCVGLTHTDYVALKKDTEGFGDAENASDRLTSNAYLFIRELYA